MRLPEVAVAWLQWRLARTKNAPLPRTIWPFRADRVGHFWRANQGNFSRVPKPGITEVAIAAPVALHYEFAGAALLAGKNVFVEKPLCLQVEQGEELVDIAKKQGLVLMGGHLLQ